MHVRHMLKETRLSNHVKMHTQKTTTPTRAHMNQVLFSLSRDFITTVRRSSLSLCDRQKALYMIEDATNASDNAVRYTYMNCCFCWSLKEGVWRTDNALVDQVKSTHVNTCTLEQKFVTKGRGIVLSLRASETCRNWNFPF